MFLITLNINVFILRRLLGVNMNSNIDKSMVFTSVVLTETDFVLFLCLPVSLLAALATKVVLVLVAPH